MAPEDTKDADLTAGAKPAAGTAVGTGADAPSVGGKEVAAPPSTGPGAVDTSAAQPVAGRPTVQTSHGELDLATVRGNRVGGQGVVHEHAAGPAMTEDQKKEATPSTTDKTAGIKTK